MLARLVPLFMPDLLFRLGLDGQPLFKEFAAAIEPTEFLPGQRFGSGTYRRTLAGIDLPLQALQVPTHLRRHLVAQIAVLLDGFVNELLEFDGKIIVEANGGGRRCACI